jgi:hypothetical protein
MSDIGKYDVVAAVRQRLVVPAFTPGRGCYIIMPGMRATVAGLTEPRPNFCDTCGAVEGPGLVLEEYPLIPGLSWCKCEWKRIGGSQGDHVAWFEVYVKPKPVPAALAKPGILRRLGLT